MSPDDSNFEDPFAEDEAARERARRRAARESKRRERDTRASLASRVSGALDGAASRGREAIEQQRERARSQEPPSEGVEPPSFRRPAVTPKAEDSGPELTVPPSEAPPEAERSVAPADGERRLTAEEAMPRRESLFTPRAPDTSEGDALAPEPVVVPASRRPAGESEEWGAPPPQEPAVVRSGGDGGRRRPAQTSGSTMWRRRALALAAIVAIVAAGAFVVSKVGGGGEPAPSEGATKPLKTIDVTIPEGLTADEIAGVAKKAGLEGDYWKAVKEAAKKFDVQKLGGPKDAGLEGFLFPATYEVEKGANVSDLVDKQLYEGFEPNFAQVDMSKAKKAGFSEFDVVTIASMIEREVQVPEEAPKVAAVIYNRVEQGQPLQIDATVRYAIGNDFSKSLEPADLEVDSPYNTYKYPGLPAGPISNPGLNSLQAAANPSDDDYLYYVVKPGTCPAEHFFTADYDEFVNASNEYDAAQAAAGGKPNC